MTEAERLLKWNVPANLRWLADNPGAPYLPCGMLHGVFLTLVADEYHRLAQQSSEGREREPNKPLPTDK